jgi:uncharacterized protein
MITYYAKMTGNGIMSNRETFRTSQAEEAFDVDGMLGRLAKWLRILGFDTAYSCKKPSEDRYFVTANKRTRDPRAIIVEGSDPVEQLKQVLDAARVVPDPSLFLSRCLLCNVLVREIPNDKVRDRVPAGICEAVSVFNECPRCGRLYWEGSHADRIRLTLRKIGILTIPAQDPNPTEQNT